MPADDPQRPEKREAFLAFLADGWVSVHFDARREGVVVPTHLRSEARLVLQYGRDMPVPIPDLRVGTRGVEATLSFARQPQATFVPWEAVYVIACTDGRGVVYQEDVPPEVVAAARRAEAEAERTNGAAARPARKPTPSETSPNLVPTDTGSEPDIGEPPPRKRHLSSVPAPPDPAVAEDASPPEASLEARPARKRRPTLRLVK